MTHEETAGLIYKLIKSDNRDDTEIAFSLMNRDTMKYLDHIKVVEYLFNNNTITNITDKLEEIYHECGMFKQYREACVLYWGKIYRQPDTYEQSFRRILDPYIK